MTPSQHSCPFDSLDPMDRKSGLLQVVVETPRGSRNKYKYDPELHVFRLNSVLPAGASFPYDFGYVPGTVGEDGDPLDVLLLMDQPAFTGCIVLSRLIGVLEAEQTEEGKAERNDRLVAVADDAHNYRELVSLKDVNSHLLEEVEHFFASYNAMKGKQFKLLARRGPRIAEKIVKKGMRSAVNKNKRP